MAPSHVRNVKTGLSNAKKTHFPRTLSQVPLLSATEQCLLHDKVVGSVDEVPIYKDLDNCASTP